MATLELRKPKVALYQMQQNYAYNRLMHAACYYTSQGKRVELVNRAATGIRGMLYFLGTNQPETFLLPEKDNLQCFNFVMCDACDRIVI